MAADEEILGIHYGARVEGVGWLHWAVTGSSSTDPMPNNARTFAEFSAGLDKMRWTTHYGLPEGEGGEHRFKMELRLDEPFRTSGAENVNITAGIEGVRTDHMAFGSEGDNEKRLPVWFIDYLHELRRQVGAGDLWCFYECESVESGNPFRMEIDVSYGQHVIEDPSLFLDDTAKQLARFADMAHLQPQLEQAYRDHNAAECYRLLEEVPYGATLDIDKAVFRLVRALPEEQELMAASLAQGRELALVKSGAEQAVIKGQDLAVALDDFYPEISRIINPPERAGIFTHTHPSLDDHPFPSWGDVLHWGMIEAGHPNVQNRIVFQGADEPKAFRFLHFYGKLFADS